MPRFIRMLIVTAAILTAPVPSVVAQIDTSLASSLRSYDLPYFTYGAGLGITSPDSLYKLNIRFRMQSRVGMEIEEGEVSAVQARVRRLRLRFDGFIYTTRLRYAIPDFEHFSCVFLLIPCMFV